MNNVLLELRHDGSIIEMQVCFSEQPVKIGYSILLVTGLLILAIPGYFICHYPVKIK